MGVHSLRAGDVKQLIDSPLREVRSALEGVYGVEFWQVSGKGAIWGAGFTITGRRKTDFLTWSERDPWHVWTEDGQVHVVRDLCLRGLKLSEAETKRFMDAWRGDHEDAREQGGVFVVYQRSRQASPPPTYTLEQAMAQPWGAPIREALTNFGRVPEPALPRARRDVDG